MNVLDLFIQMTYDDNWSKNLNNIALIQDGNIGESAVFRSHQKLFQLFGMSVQLSD